MHLDVSDPERFHLARLHRFASLAVISETLPRSDWRVLARHATLAAYRDCVALGIDGVARDVLRLALAGARAAQPLRRHST
jgi:hypothetical protein